MKSLLSVVCLTLTLLAPARAQDAASYDKKAAEIADKAIAWLRNQQDGKTGGWSVPKEGPAYPAISALVLSGMLMQPGLDAKDPSIAKGVAYILSLRQTDGGIYDRILPSYNTAIALSCLAKVNTPEAKAAIKPAQDFLRTLQFGEGAMTEGPFAKETGRVGKDHPFYGGMGYGNGGRPDLSNTAFFLEAMHDSGVPGDDPAFQRALAFLARVQMLEKAPDGKTINDMDYAKGSRQGGFIYSTSENKDKVGSGETKASAAAGGPAMIEETLDDGSQVSRLRAYGSMTYAGFKSLIYAQLPPSDPRLTEALRWIRENYTLEENPGIGRNGVYYYLLTFSRALKASGLTTVGPAPKDPSPGAAKESRDWRRDLIDRLGQLQESDGSFKVLDKRWLEDNKVLITAYALLALQHARQ